MLDFPEIHEQLATAPVPQPAAAQHIGAITASIGVVSGEVSKFNQIASGLAALESAHPKNVIVAAIDTPAGFKVAEAAWRAWRNPRLEVERARKAAKAPVLVLGKAIDTFAGSLEDRLREGETHYKAWLDAEEKRRAAIKAEQERIAREEAAKHAARVGAVNGYAERCREHGMTAGRIAAGMARLEAADLSDPDNARAVELADARCRTLEVMRTLHAQAVAREAEAARQEAIRIENERVAKELAAERARIEAEAAEVRRQVAELAAAEEAARKAEAGRLATQLAEDQRKREEAADKAIREGQRLSQAQVEADRKKEAEAHHAIVAVQACRLEDRAMLLTPAGAELVAKAVDALRADEPATLSLGAIKDRLGFSLPGEFIAATLKIEPTATNKSARLYTESQWVQIKARLVAHIVGLA